MRAEQVQALRRAAADGVSRDGLAARIDDDGLHVSVGEEAAASGDATVSVADPDAADLADRLEPLAVHVEEWFFWEHAVPPGDHRRAFLRWVEDAYDHPVPARRDRLATGVVAEWGQLRIEAGLGEDGERRYDLRHVGDAEAAADALMDHEDPHEAPRLAERDDRDRYRPLRTAPSLRTGWRFPALDAAGLVAAVSGFYPATIANWYREREGDLDVDHWVETAERQTGIYDLVDELPREALEWVAEACCADSQCLKRREWEYDEGDELAVDGGDGRFPCREPCSLVIAGARRWTILEDETERTYELRLTPGERRQLAELLDAVAEGRIDEVREADFGDGANRYRARYLRAKRLDEGDLGTEVDDGDPGTEVDDGE